MLVLCVIHQGHAPPLPDFTDAKTARMARAAAAIKHDFADELRVCGSGACRVDWDSTRV